jgi:hypothetical protein
MRVATRRSEEVPGGGWQLVWERVWFNPLSITRGGFSVEGIPLKWEIEDLLGILTVDPWRPSTMLSIP